MTGKATKPRNRRHQPNKLDDASSDYVPPLRPAISEEYDGLFKSPKFDTSGNKYGPKDDPRRREIILAWLAAGWSRGRACDEAGVHVRTFTRWREDDPAFNEVVKDAIERGTDLIEDAAKFRATQGIAEPVYQGGLLVGYKLAVSDSLMQMLLGGRRAMYNKRQLELNGPNGGNIPVKVEVEFVAPKKAE
jgi:hypothetical protein